MYHPLSLVVRRGSSEAANVLLNTSLGVISAELMRRHRHNRQVDWWGGEYDESLLWCCSWFNTKVKVELGKSVLLDKGGEESDRWRAAIIGRVLLPMGAGCVYGSLEAVWMNICNMRSSIPEAKEVSGL